VKQPPGFEDLKHPDYVYNCLVKSLLVVIEQRKSLGVVLEHRSLFQVRLSIEVSLRCP